MPDAKLFVGNLPKSVTSPELKGLFISLNKEIKRYFVATNEAGESKGFGFLTVNAEDKEAFITADIVVNGNRLAINTAIDKDDKHNYIKFFVRNLNYKATREDLLNVLRAKGITPINVVLAKHKDGSSRGIGFILIDRIDETSLKELDGTELMGRPFYLVSYKEKETA